MSIYQGLSTKDSHWAYIDVMPTCDFCDSPAEYDACLRGSTTWAFFCCPHFQELGIGLGLGLGQKLILRSNND